MPVDRIDANIQSYISSAQIQTEKKIDKDDDSDHARKVAEKKILLKKERLKNSAVHKEIFARQTDTEQKMQQVLGGRFGPEAQEQLNNWQDNQQLQSKLTEAQKNLFREAMAKNPPRASKSARAMNNLTEQPGFGKAVNNSQQMGTLQKGMLENPAAEKPVSEMLQGRFMQSAKADPHAKNSFLRFGLEQAKKGNLASIKKAGDMLGTLAKNSMTKGSQRAAANMAARQPTNEEAMDNVDSFVQHPDVSKMPNFARGKATEMLAKAGGKKTVKEGFEKLAGDTNFKAQTAQNKGRFFATIGTGRTSEYRALTDKSLQALQSAGFPKRAGQVGKFLTKMAGQIQKGGAEGVDVESAMKAAKSSPLPSPPKLVSTSDDMDPEELARARSQNRAQIIQFYTKLQRSYEQGEKKLNSAKYLEDVNSLQNLREPPGFDSSALSPEEQAFVQERHQSVMSTLGRVRKLQRQKARELRTKRMPPAKRRALARRRRIQGRQPKYFNPNAGKAGSSQAFLQAAAGAVRQSLPQNPMRAQLGRRAAAGGNVGDVQGQVAAALSQLGDGPITPDMAGQVAQAIASSVAQQVAAQVTQQLLGSAAAAGPAAAPVAAPEVDAAPIQGRTQQGKIDGWGIPRSFERDLGGANHAVVKPKSDMDSEGPSMAEVLNERYTGRMLVKDPSSIRPLGELFASTWKNLNKPEMALLKNLGWNQQMWDTKDTPAAKWPVQMMTAFVNLNPTQREAVRKLGFTPHDWDQKVQAFTMGKNA